MRETGNIMSAVLAAPLAPANPHGLKLVNGDQGGKAR